MNRPSSLHELRGVIGFALTPFDRSGELDIASAEAYLQWLSTTGVEAVAVGGAVGEVFALRPGEYEELIRIAGTVVPASAHMIVGITTAHGLEEAQARLAGQVGASALLVHSPYGADWTTTSLRQASQKLSAVAGIPVILFNTRQRPLGDDTLAACAAEPGVVGVKDETHDPEAFAGRVAAYGTELLMINGSAEAYAWDYHGRGAVAMTSGIVNLVPSASLSVWEACKQGNRTLVERLLRSAIDPIDRLRRRSQSHHVSVLKCGLSLEGWMSDVVRPPLDQLQQHEMEQVREALAADGTLAQAD